MHNNIAEPTCPEDYTLYPGESDGRTCYKHSEDAAAKQEDAMQKCSSINHHQQRLGLPDTTNLLDLLKPAAR